MFLITLLNYHLLGPLCIALSLLIAGYLFMSTKDSVEAVSYLATKSQAALIRFGVTLTIIGLGLLGFGLGWLVPTYHLGAASNYIFVVMLISLFVLGWVPVSAGRKEQRIHRYAGYGLAGTILILISVLAQSSENTGVSKFICAVVAILMAITWIIFVYVLVTKDRRINRYFLRFELAYIALAQVVIVAVAIHK
jgi:hypothetical protein